MRKSRFISRHLQKCDLYGQSAQLTIDGQEKKKSCFGGIITLIVMILVLVYGIFRFINEASEVYTWTYVESEEQLRLTSFSSNTREYIMPHDNGNFLETLGLGNAFDKNNLRPKLDPSIGSFSFNQRNGKSYDYIPAIECKNNEKYRLALQSFILKELKA